MFDGLSTQGFGMGEERGKVTGIGGVFFLANEDNAALAQWYQENLGLPLEPWGGAALEWRHDTAEDGGATVWHIGAQDSDWFAPSRSRFMVNYRVDDMDALLAKLKSRGIEPISGPQYHENGVFVHLLDPEGHKIELWEPKLWDDKNKR